MKKKKLNTILGIMMTAAMISTVNPAAIMADELPLSGTDETVAYEDKDLATPDVSEISGLTDETETEQDTAKGQVNEDESLTDGFQEGSAILSDYAFEAGYITAEGWISSYLNMKYAPGSGIHMGVEENETIEEYHLRNGEDKQVAHNEMVAVNEDGGYVQIMVEVNPNDEKEEDIISRFAVNEGLELLSETKVVEVAGRSFLTCTGVKNKEKVMIGVCTEPEDVVIALKVKYENTTARINLLNGFSEAKKNTKKKIPEGLGESESMDTRSDSKLRKG